MSNGGVVVALCAIAVVVVLVTLAMVAYVDRQLDRRNPSAPSRGSTEPTSLPADAVARIWKATIPCAIGAFVFGLLAFRRVWAGIALAAIAVAYARLLPAVLWKHVQARRSD
jgi:hypothetical protein